MNQERGQDSASPQLTVPFHVPQELERGEEFRKGDPCTLVILGALGDLTQRKLVPALAHLYTDGLLHDAFRIIGVARQDLDDAAFRERMHEAVQSSEHTATLGAEVWSEFAQRLFYVCGDLRDDALYERLEKQLSELEADDRERSRLFYFAVPPSVYGPTVRKLASSGVAPRRAAPEARPWCRIIIEKPFGTSEETAHDLNRTVAEDFAEHQVYRIDHFLGKETVQNLLVFRFANSIFEPVWNRSHIHHVQITAAETVGVEHRAGFYEEAGVVRDMFQNHLLQLLCLTAMEPPTTFRADAVRDEKTKVLNAIRPFDPDHLDEHAVRAQYGPGEIDGEAVPGYLQEPDVGAGSTTATWAALRVLIDNWRWQGVPFFLRSGKRMARRATEIAIRFRRPPHLMFPEHTRQIQPNLLTFHVQPDEGISLCMEIKVPGMGVRMTSARMDFSYAEAFGDHRHSAYETLLLDAMQGDQTLFARSDAVEAAWRVVDPVIATWERTAPKDFPNYAAGSWGPDAADTLAAHDGVRWRRPG